MSLFSPHCFQILPDIRKKRILFSFICKHPFIFPLAFPRLQELKRKFEKKKVVFSLKQDILPSDGVRKFSCSSSLSFPGGKSVEGAQEHTEKLQGTTKNPYLYPIIIIGGVCFLEFSHLPHQETNA